MARHKKLPQDFDDQPQPSLIRKPVKLRPETLEILSQVAAFRGEKMIDCIHNLLVEEVERKAEEMKRRIDHLMTLKVRSSNSNEDE